MYQFISAYIMPAQEWERSTTLGEEILADIYATQRMCYLNVYETIHDVNQQIDLMELKDTLISDPRTVNQWLLDNGDNVLPTMLSPKRLDVLKKHRYSDSSHNEYNLYPVKAGFSYDPDVVNNKTPDFLVEGDYTARDSIATVNGFLHYMEDIPTGTTIFNGYLTIDKSHVTQYGLHSFKELAILTQHKLLPEEIQITDSGITIKTQQDLRYVTPLLSLGGFLFTLGNNFSVIGDHTLALLSNNIDWPAMILNSQDVLNVDYLGLTRLPGSKKGVVIPEVFDVETITKYLLGPYSFLIYISPLDSTQPLAKTVYPLDDVGTGLGKYISLKPPAGLVVDDLGRVLNYEIQPDDGDYVVSVEPGRINLYEYHKAPWRDVSVVDNTRDAPYLRTATPNVKNINYYQLG